MINRRTMIQTAPIAAAALTIGTVAPASETDPHRAWVGEHKAAYDRLFAPDAPDFESDNPDWVRLQELDKLICTTPAKTPEGAAAQLEFALSDEANFDLTGGVAHDLDDRALRNVLATLITLT